MNALELEVQNDFSVTLHSANCHDFSSDSRLQYTGSLENFPGRYYRSIDNTNSRFNHRPLTYTEDDGLTRWVGNNVKISEQL